MMDKDGIAIAVGGGVGYDDAILYFCKVVTAAAASVYIDPAAASCADIGDRRLTVSFDSSAIHCKPSAAHIHSTTAKIDTGVRVWSCVGSCIVANSTARHIKGGA